MSFDAVKVTIFVPTRDRLAYLRECVASVLAQTLDDLRVIVLDNASAADVPSAMSAFQDPRVSVIRHPVNIGSRANINMALELARTPYFLIFHDDDTMRPDLLRCELDLMERDPTLAFVGAGYREVRDHATMRRFEPIREVTVDRFPDARALVRFLMSPGTLHFGSVMYRRTAAAGQWLDGAKYGRMADRPLLVSIATDCPSACLRGPWVNYRLHSSQDTHVGPLQEAHVRAFLSSYRVVLEPGWDSGTRRLFFKYASNVFLDSYAALPLRERQPVVAALMHGVRDGVLHPWYVRRQGAVALGRSLIGAAGSSLRALFHRV